MIRQIIFDTETTGLSTREGHRVIEIGCVEMINRKITGNNFHYYLNPNREIDEDSIKVHGLTKQFLANKPSFGHIINEFIDYVQGAELIAHNASFDVDFINYEFSLQQDKLGKLIKITDIASITDTLVLAKKMHPGQRNSLDALCKRYSVDNTERNLHGALLDSLLLAKVYLAMTGGQSSFEFLSTTSSAHHANTDCYENINQESSSKSENSPHILKDNLKIINANEEELANHAKFLTFLDSKAEDGCLWLELPN